MEIIVGVLLVRTPKKILRFRGRIINPPLHIFYSNVPSVGLILNYCSESSLNGLNGLNRQNGLNAFTWGILR
jgi:hypothetical protein